MTINNVIEILRNPSFEPTEKIGKALKVAREIKMQNSKRSLDYYYKKKQKSN